MTQGATQNLAKLLPAAPVGNLLLLPQSARAALFASYGGAAVLLTTPDRISGYALAGALGAPISINPSLRDWSTKHEHVVLDVRTAMDLFPAKPEDHSIGLVVGKSYPRAQLIETLEKLGFERGEEPGFEIRGDTLEIKLEPGSGLPADVAGGIWLRAEFFGDELDTLRQCVAGEASGNKIKSFSIEPSAEYLSESRWDSTRLEQLGGRIFLDSPEFYSSSLGVLTDSLWSRLGGREITCFGRSPIELPDVQLNLKPLGFYRARLGELQKDLDNWKKSGYRVFFLLRHQRTANYLAEKLLGSSIVPWLSIPRLEPGEVGFLVAAGEGGFEIPEHKTVVITEDLIYGFQGGSALRGKKLSGKPISDALGLHVGDFLIHPEHGVGKFEGLEARKILGVTRDYVNIEYRAGARLSVPIEHLSVLRRHHGTTDDPPKLSSFDKKDWIKVKEKARKNAEEIASRLLVQYAARQLIPGSAFPEQEDWDKQIEDNFEYTLTKDQTTALKETFTDLEKENPTDRLISGDVGFGKTEVALRAAHRVVGHGKQVAILVPTTLLAEQHTSTFIQRFKGLPVKVEGLSRFVSAQKTKQVLAELKAGKVDILIGTHRLLSGDIEFKDLGLIIVDEEHRFGVSQKEKLRALRGLPELSSGKLQMPEGVKAVDTLALSATPIPRSMYMSMVGLRDLSSIQTPPIGRKPIQTILSPFDPMTVRSAVVSELERSGKVFYIHDRIASIGARSIYLRSLIPEARIGVAHGRMNEEELEEVMLGFEEGAFDVLVSTTIVETGLDIPEANTILIERADRLGLAQLYQLRGRVGRRHQSAYAYLFYPPRLTENAQRRLWAISDLQDLGSGHLLAEKDMEIRGVGNILGEEQHGHVQAVSSDLYTEMLAEAVAKLKGEEVKAPPSISINLPINARLSTEYFENDEEARIASYGRLSEAKTLQAISRVERDLRKKYGIPTPEVQNFLDLAKLRLTSIAKRATSIGETLTELQITFGYKNLDYDAKSLRNFPHKYEIQTFPPSIKIEKRGISPDRYTTVLLDLLGYFG